MDGWDRAGWKMDEGESHLPPMRHRRESLSFIFPSISIKVYTWMNSHLILFSFKLLHYCVSPPMFQMGEYYSFLWQFSWKCRYYSSSNKCVWKRVCMCVSENEMNALQCFDNDCLLSCYIAFQWYWVCSSVCRRSHWILINYVSLLPWKWQHLLTTSDECQIYVILHSAMFPIL